MEVAEYKGPTDGRDSGTVMAKEEMSCTEESKSRKVKDEGNKHIEETKDTEDFCVKKEPGSRGEKQDKEIKQENIKTTLKEIITEIEEHVGVNGVDHLQSSEKENQPPNTSLTTPQPPPMEPLCNGYTEPTKRLLSQLEEIKFKPRPQSLPSDANLFHLWQSLQIASELKHVLKESEGQNGIQEASGQKINTNDGLDPRPIDLEKLFTPASDSGEVTPSRQRRMYSSSSFYSPHHPTMDEQVELARRISHSLSDISNQQSKGQSMYVNRKKRSVKWVHGAGAEHEGSVNGYQNYYSTQNENIEPNYSNRQQKPILNLVMDPRGKVRDLETLKREGYEVDHGSPPPLSPQTFDLVSHLNAPTGKGAEMFAKRRKKCEQFIVDENNVKNSNQFQQRTPTTPQPPPTYLHDSHVRTENIHRMNEIQERFNQPRLRLVKSPWESALETGSVEAAFQEVRPPLLPPRGYIVAPTPPTMEKIFRAKTPTHPGSGHGENVPPNAQQPRAAPKAPPSPAYKNKCARGWNPNQRPDEPQNFVVATCNWDKPPKWLSMTFQDYSNMKTYNTAARGWAPKMDYYRPVLVNGNQHSQAAYTDF